MLGRRVFAAVPRPRQPAGAARRRAGRAPWPLGHGTATVGGVSYRWRRTWPPSAPGSRTSSTASTWCGGPRPSRSSNSSRRNWPQAQKDGSLPGQLSSNRCGAAGRPAAAPRLPARPGGRTDDRGRRARPVGDGPARGFLPARRPRGGAPLPRHADRLVRACCRGTGDRVAGGVRRRAGGGCAAWRAGDPADPRGPARDPGRVLGRPAWHSCCRGGAVFGDFNLEADPVPIVRRDCGRRAPRSSYGPPFGWPRRSPERRGLPTS